MCVKIVVFVSRGFLQSEVLGEVYIFGMGSSGEVFGEVWGESFGDVF